MEYYNTMYTDTKSRDYLITWENVSGIFLKSKLKIIPTICELKKIIHTHTL